MTPAPGARSQAPDPPSTVFTLPLPGGRRLRLGERTLVMGILNVTPDSFSDGGRHADAAAAADHAERLVGEGADILDVGGESTRPGAVEVPADEQRRRVLPVLAELARRLPRVPISIDTRNAEVARAAVDGGAAIVNDVSGLSHDPRMSATVAGLGVPAVIMHMRGTPADMREHASYGDVVADVLRELRVRLAAVRAAGVEHVIADPGIGFAKTAEQSVSLLAHTDRFRALGVPLLVGPSRKSFLASATARRAPRQPEHGDGSADASSDGARLAASVAAATVAALLGAHIVRVHDVRACADGVALADALRRSRGLGDDWE